MVMALQVMTNEMRKKLLINWDYKFSILTQLVGLGFVFTGILFFTGKGTLQPEALSSAFVGFLTTFYVLETASNMSYSLAMEAQAGTLEQMYMSPAPPAVVLLGHTFAGLLTSTIELVIVSVALLLLFQIQIPFVFAGIVPLLLTLIGVLGFGLLIGGVTLVFKQVGPLANTFTNILLFVNGAFLPVEYMPDALATAARFLPSTQGIIVMRKIMLDGQSLAEVWADGSLVLLVAHSLVFFIGGWIIFNWCQNIAKRAGTLGQY